MAIKIKPLSCVLAVFRRDLPPLAANCTFNRKNTLCVFVRPFNFVKQLCFFHFCIRTFKIAGRD